MVASTTTDAQGEYSVSGLPSGTYYVRTQNDLGYVDEIYDGLPASPALLQHERRDSVTVTSGTPTTGIDFALARSGSISGTVRDAGTQTPLAGAQLFLLNAEWIPLDATDASRVTTSSGTPGGDLFARRHEHVGLRRRAVRRRPLPRRLVLRQRRERPSSSPRERRRPGSTSTCPPAARSPAGSRSKPPTSPSRTWRCTQGNTNGLSRRGYADALGQYTISGLPSGTYRVTTGQRDRLRRRALRDVECPNESLRSDLRCRRLGRPRAR